MPIPDDDLTPLYACGKAVTIESNGDVKPNGTGATDDPNERTNWWAVYIGRRRVATGPTLADALRSAADACRGAR